MVIEQETTASWQSAASKTPHTPALIWMSSSPVARIVSTWSPNTPELGTLPYQDRAGQVIHPQCAPPRRRKDNSGAASGKLC
jgi:hypothetical protein